MAVLTSTRTHNRRAICGHYASLKLAAESLCRHQTLPSSGGNQTPLSSSDAAFFLSQITLRLVRGQTATKPLMPCPSSTLSCRGVGEVMLSSKGLLPYHMERAGRLCRRHLRSCGRQELSRNQTLIKASASSKMVGNHLCANMLMMPVSPTPAPPERT